MYLFFFGAILPADFGSAGSGYKPWEDHRIAIADPGCFYRKQDPGSDFFPYRIPVPGLIRSGIRVCIREFNYFHPRKKLIPQSSQK
jgi:hypothetical protein